MGKGGKSSASSGTRKKHARKAGKDEDDLPPVSKQRGQKKQVRGPDGKKLSKAQRKALPKSKTYIPPPKPPAPPIPDPLDGQGLARTLPAELVVTLRRLGKKDDVTRRKGLEELKDQWVAPVLRKADGEDAEAQQSITLAALQSALPVWLHNLASLLQSPFHRGLALQLHTEMMGVPELRGGVLDSLAMSYLPGTQDRDIVGSWLVAALEERRAGGLKMFEDLVGLGPKETPEGEETGHLDLVPHLPALAEFLSLAILDPKTLHRDIHPAPVQNQFESAKQAKEAAKNQNQKGKGKGKPAKPATPVAATPPPEEDPQLAEERWTRYRVGGLAGLAWIIPKLSSHAPPFKSEEIDSLLRNPVTWSSLGPAHVIPDVDPIGTAPLIRRGGYNLLQSVLQNVPELDSELLAIIATSVLGNCWRESEAIVWEVAGSAVLRFLTKYRHAWDLAAKAPAAETEGDGDDDDDDDDDDEDDDAEESTPAPSGTVTPAASGAVTPAPTTSKALDSFLNFISTVCPSLPHLTYPLLVVIVSTLPPTLLPLNLSSLPLQNLFSHLWSPVDARLLSTHSLGAQPSAFQSFLQSAADVTQLLIDRTHASEQETAQWLVKNQLGERVWGEGVTVLGAKGGRRGATPVETEAKIFAQTAGKTGKAAPELLAPLLAEVERLSLAACFPETGTGSFLPRALAALTEVRDVAPEAVDTIIRKIAENSTEHLFQLDNAPVYAAALTNILRKRKDLFPADEVSALSQGLQAHTAELVEALQPNDVASLFAAVADVAGPEKDALLSSLKSYAESEDVPREKRFALTSAIVSAGGLLDAGSMDQRAQEASRAALETDDSTAISITASAVTSDDWLSPEVRDSIIGRACATISDAADALLSTGEDYVIPSSALTILSSYAQKHIDHLVQSDENVLAVIAAHHYVIVLPRLGLDIPTPAAATEIWKATASLSPELKDRLDKAVTSSLAELLGRVSCRVDPGTIVDVALATDRGVSPTPEHVASTLLPSPETLVEFLSRHTAQPPHPSLPVIDPMVQCTQEVEEAPATEFDVEGRSRAARYAEAALALLRADRSLVKVFPSLLNVALAAMILAEDGAAIPGASRGMYAAGASHLANVVRDAEGALSFSLSLVDEPPLSWHKETIEQLKAGTTPDGADYLQRLLGQLRLRTEEGRSDVAPRAFREVLSRHLRKCGAGEEEGSVWLDYAMRVAERLPALSLAVILSIKPFMLETKAFATAQNRLASGLTGIRVADANAKGLPAIRELVASAPPADSTAIFLPQQRAVFVLRHVGGWLTSEDEAADDLAEEVDVRVAELYTALAPIVQDLHGAHWDSIFDLIEGALSSGTLDDASSHPLIYAGLGMLRAVRDLAATNRHLAEWWTQRDAHMGLVVELFLQCRAADSVPLQLIHGLILDLVHDASASVMARAGLPQLCTLLTESDSAAIQTTAYRLLAQVIRQRTLALVLEVEASVADEPEEQPRQLTLPAHLVSIADAGRAVDWEESSVPAVLGQLLAWMALLDHFDDASRTLRWAYLDQLTSSKLLEESLLPLLFTMLGVSEVGARTFPASAYAVDEFYVDQLLPDSLADLVPLASHVYYRALVTIPSAMRAYYEGLKDRQLSLALLQFTARHYSSVIIGHEFAALKEPAALSTLTEEGLNVRVATGGGSGVAGASSAEAIASYVVDEQPMEIGIRLPAEFPLRGVEIRDLKRVGVPENKWRGWLMSVQQTITSRNGLILEALTVFKRNVALHFEGVVECAICYSIISLTDRSLPTKPCRTCKNRFHASCLFKWFNSSHSSSCPLCRSLF